MDDTAKTLTKAQLDAAIGYIKASNTDGLDAFGNSLSLSADGTTLAVGAWLEYSNTTGVSNSQYEWSSRCNNDGHDTGAVCLYQQLHAQLPGIKLCSATRHQS